MVDASPPADRPASSVCPWCSTPLGPDAVTCPSCGVALTGDEEPHVPGVTAVDQRLVARTRRPPTKSPSRLMAWIAGDSPDDIPSEAETKAFAPPELDVRREILRLELEAEVAKLQAETDAILSEAVAEGRAVEIPQGRAVEIPEDAPPA